MTTTERHVLNTGMQHILHHAAYLSLVTLDLVLVHLLAFVVESRGCIVLSGFIFI